MATRELTHPEFDIQDDDDDLRVTFRIPGTTFVLVEVVLSVEEVDRLVGALEQAVVFAGATFGDSDG